MKLHRYELPFTLELVEKWPFGCKISDANGKQVLAEDPRCYSTEQKTREDHEAGVGFSHYKRPRYPDETTMEEAAGFVTARVLLFRLFAAAPELAEALKRAVEALEAHSDGHEGCGKCQKVMDKARAALKKAGAQ